MNSILPLKDSENWSAFERRLYLLDSQCVRVCKMHVYNYVYMKMSHFVRLVGAMLSLSFTAKTV